MFTDPNREASADPCEALATIANRYLDHRREFDQAGRQPTDEEVGALNEGQQELLDRMQDTPAVRLDDLVAKLLVIREEIWDRAAGDEERLEAADRLVLTLADDVRRVLGATAAYRFDARLWVESAIRAGMEPIAMMEAAPGDAEPCAGRAEARRGLFYKLDGVNPTYEPPNLRSVAERAAVVDELVRRGRVEDYTRPARDAVAAE